MTTTPANERNDSERMSKLEGAYEQVNERLGEMNARIDVVRIEMNERLGEMNTRISEVRTEMNERINETNARIDNLSAQMNARFNGILVLMLGSWVTTIGVIVGLSFR